MANTKSKTSFIYTLEDGRTIKAPAFRTSLKTGWLRKHRNDSEMEQMFSLVEDVLDAESLEILDDLPATADPETPDEDSMEKFFTAWQEDSGVTAGESSAS